MVDNSTAVEKTPPPSTIIVVADGKIINPSNSINSKTSPRSSLATGDVKEADPILDMIDILHNVNNPPPPAVINLPSSSTSEKPKEQFQVVAKNAPTSFITV